MAVAVHVMSMIRITDLHLAIFERVLGEKQLRNRYMRKANWSAPNRNDYEKERKNLRKMNFVARGGI